MSALENVLDVSERDCIENELPFWLGVVSDARAELAALLARIAELEADVATMEVTEYEAERFAPEYERQIKEPLEQRIAELVTAVREVQTQIRATSRNWDEDCLYRADDILTNALAAHPAPQPVTP
jgi:hypothetical protein